MQSSYVPWIMGTLWFCCYPPRLRLLLASLLVLLPFFAVSQTCNPTQQGAALSLFYEQSGGPAWFNNSGWSDPGAGLPCMAGLTLLPSHCCWYGVSCCTPATCTDAAESACNCTVGLVTVLTLQANNVISSTEVSGAASSATNFISIGSSLACNLMELDLSQNSLSGTLPLEISEFSQLESLNLAYNRLGGTVPGSFGNMTALQYIDLSWNNITGSVPESLCQRGRNSSIVFLFLGYNQLTGSLNLTHCGSLSFIDVTGNALTGELPPVMPYNKIYTAHLAYNMFTLISAGAHHVTDLNLAYNLLTGTLPSGYGGLQSLNTLSLLGNNYTGSIPYSLMSLGSLTYLSLSAQWLEGPLPSSLGLASALVYLDLSNNSLTGTIPNGITNAISTYGSYVDMRMNYMSCCGVDFEYSETYSVTFYSWYNLSAPRLPSGLAFSSQLRPVVYMPNYQDAVWTFNVGNSTYPGMSCPYLRRESDPDEQYYLLNWYLDPEYYLYEGCKCAAGSELVYVLFHNLQVAQCVAPFTPTAPWWQRMPWIFVIIALSGAAFLVALAWVFIFKRGARPQLLQDVIDLRKRLRGAPTGGTVSIVVTDIQGFSELMKAHPEQAVEALIIHNNLITKAKWDCFGSTVEQEGDSFSIIFAEAGDAAKFCLQAQLLLADQIWPSGLFPEGGSPDKPHKSQRGSVGNPSSNRDSGETGAHTSFMSGVRKRVKRMVRAAELGGTPPGSRRASTDDGGISRISQGGVSVIFGSQRQGSFSSLRPLPTTAAGGSAAYSARESGGLGDNRGLSSDLQGRDAMNSSGDDTTGQPLSRLHSYSNMRPSGAGEATVGSLPIAIHGGGSGTLGTRPLSFSSGSRGMASELAVLAGLRQASVGRGGFGAAACDKRVLSTTNEGSVVAPTLLMSSQSMSQRYSAPLTCRQHTDVTLGRLTGLRVRMGIATGNLTFGASPAGSAVMDRAKIVSDAAWGGQTLMCATTFLAVKEHGQELGRVTRDGLKRQQAGWSWAWWRSRKEHREAEAVMLNMGLWRSSALPPLLSPQHFRDTSSLSRDSPEASARSSSQGRGSGSSVGPSSRSGQQAATGGPAARDSTTAATAAATIKVDLISAAPPNTAGNVGGSGGGSGGRDYRERGGEESGSHASQALCTSTSSLAGARDPTLQPSLLRRSAPARDLLPRPRLLQLYQVIAPALLSRGRIFGSRLALGPDWQQLHAPYFDAPGSTFSPLGLADRLPAGLWIPPVTVVFCKVDGGGHSMIGRREADEVHVELVALMCSVMRQIPGSYLVRQQDGDLKYIVAFGSPEDALLWCIAVQECAMYVQWPYPSGLHSGMERGQAGKLLFRGPRIKMGVCEGVPGSIMPDHMGRADYHGASVNQAARFMDAGAHGGQVVCEEDLAVRVFRSWEQRAALGDAAKGATLAALAGGQANLQRQATDGLLQEIEEASFSGAPVITNKAAATSSGPCPGAYSGGEGAASGKLCALSRPLPSSQQQQAESGDERPPPQEASFSAATAALPLPASKHPQAAPPRPAGAGIVVSWEGLPLTSLADADTSEGCSGKAGEAAAHRLGLFRFKGSPETLSMVNIVPASLAGRRYPADPPKGGKGCRIEEALGVAAVTDRMPMLRVVQLYRNRETAAAEAAAGEASAIHPQSFDEGRQSDGRKGPRGAAAGWQTQAVRPMSAPITPSGKWQENSV